jgi:hypothetical protein
MSIYVFLGPTLAVTDARRILDATYLPPVAMGDVAAVLMQPTTPKAIAIIDGVFQNVPAVWHKEILFALSQGVRVFGSSSMGALRAAELHAFGMEGVGRVFAAYRDGVLEDDDEVAVIHGPAEFGYLQLSEAMVNIREGLGRAEANGIISAATHATLVQGAKQMFYPERSWPSVLAYGAALGLANAELVALKEFVRSAAPNLKRDDALELLQRLADAGKEGIAPHQPNFTFEPSCFWLQLVESQSSAAATSAVDGNGLCRAVSHA